MSTQQGGGQQGSQMGQQARQQYEQHRNTLRQIVQQESDPSNFTAIGNRIKEHAENGQLPQWWAQIGQAFAQSDKGLDTEDRRVMRDVLHPDQVVSMLDTYATVYQLAQFGGEGPAKSYAQSLQHGVSQCLQTAVGSSTAGSRG